MKYNDNMLKLAIFDMDGLMLDSEKLYLEAAMKIAFKYHYPLTEEIILKTMGLNQKSTRELLLKELGNDFPLEEYLDHLYKEHFEGLIHKEIPKKEGLLELLDFLKEKHIKIAVATSTARKRATVFLKNANLLPYFDHIVCGDEITNGKPDPEIYLTVLKDMHLSKEEAIVLEDSNNGLRSAINAEIPVIYVKDLALVEEGVRKRVFKETKNLKEVIDILKKEWNL